MQPFILRTWLTGYVIEYREAKSEEEWSQTDKIKPKKFLTGAVGNLVTGLKYESRVVAVNRGSRSAPSEATAPQLGRNFSVQQ